jgi:membrane protein implicated in regulation of membrane protease activity
VPWWSWIVLGAALLGAEVLLATDFYLVFFGAAAVIVGLIELASPSDLPVWAEWLLFAALAVAGLALYRKRLRERLQRPDRPLDESVVGQIAIVRGAIGAGATGRAELRGSIWRARNAADGDLADGEECRVAAVDGLTLRLERRTARP